MDDLPEDHSNIEPVVVGTVHLAVLDGLQLYVCDDSETLFECGTDLGRDECLGHRDGGFQ